MPEHRSEISFFPRIILRQNNEYIQASAVTPEDITELVNTYEKVIQARIDKSYEQSLILARRPETKVRSPILIARLALAGHERDAFTLSSLPGLQRVHDTPYDLNSNALPYWYSITNTDFLPQVVTRLSTNATPGTKGTWLAVKSQCE